MMNRKTISVLFIAVLLGKSQVCRSAFASQLPSFGVTNWTEGSDRPFHSVNAVLVDPDEVLWLGTNEGLVRFDGMQFRLYSRKNSGLPGNAVSALGRDRNGDILLGFEAGGFCRFHRGAFSCESVKSGFPFGSVRGIVRDNSDNIWVALRGNGLLRLAGVTRRLFGREDGLPSLNTSTVFTDKDGSVWAGTYDAGASRLQGGHFVALQEPRLPSNQIWSITQGTGGEIWLGTFKGLARVTSVEGAVQVYGKKDGLSSDFVTATYLDRAGRLWVATAQTGLSVLEGDKFTTLPANDGLPEAQIHSISDDAEGDLWLGTKDGLSRLRPEVFRRISTASADRNGGYRIIFEGPIKTLWLGHSGPGVEHGLSGHEQGAVPLPEMQSCSPLAGLVARDGSAWFGCSGGVIVHRRMNGQLQRFPLSGAQHFIEVNAFAETVGSRLFAGTFGDGVAEYKDGAWVSRAVLSDVQNVSAMIDSPDGLWVAAMNKGVYRVGANGEAESYSGQMNGASAQHLNLDDDGSVWVETDQGLLHITHRRAAAVDFTGSSLEDAAFYNVLSGNDGTYWVSTSRGIARIDRGAMQSGHVTEASVRLFGSSDGVRGINYNGYAQPTALKSTTGILYFPTNKGLLELDPHDIRPEARSVSVRLDGALLDGRPVSLESGVEMAAGIHQLEIEYSAVLLGQSERTRFQYLLSGVDADWVNARQGRSALYRDLPPGTYTFFVRASLDGHSWTQTPAALSVIKRPHLWERVWFRVLSVAAAALVWWWFFTQSVARARKREAQLQAAIVRERGLAAQKRAEELERSNEVLRSVSRGLVNTNDPTAILPIILEEAALGTGAIDGALFRFEPQTGLLTLCAAFYDGALSETLPGHPYGDKEHPVQTADFPAWASLNFAEPSFVEVPLEGLPKDAIPWHVERGHKAILETALVIDGKPLGLFGLGYCSMRVLNAAEMEMFRTLAQQATLALQLTRLSDLQTEGAANRAVDEERARFAREIHDTLAQSFSGILLQLRALKQIKDSGDRHAADEHLGTAMEFAQQGLTAARRSLRALRPAELQGNSLTEALALLVKTLEKRTTVPIILSVDSSVALRPHEEGEILRIVQESVINAIKHASAGSIRITLERTHEGSVELCVHDDGRGFDSNAGTEGYGLMGMRERSQRIGAEFSVQTEPTGTTVCVRLAVAGRTV